ncbi:MAG: ABC transporter ATP-binding protein [Candidatus Brockarchaeota archaeon]|nr:ABC transporter ATP-binding protein [Candidatus Brockarchaeota archaeon]
MDSAITIEDLTKVFDGFAAVDHVNLEVPKGVVFGILGPNGAGKTTLLRMLSTVLKPTRGKARILGHDILEEPIKVREVIGVLPEDTGLYDRLTPAETLLFYGKLRGMESAKILERSEVLLSLLGLSGKRDAKIGTFSKGMKQKVALMRAVLHEPDVLFLDEPTSGLDVMSAREIRGLIKDWASKGRSVVLSTHNMWEAQQLCSAVAIMDKGKVVSVGTIEELERMTKQEDLEEVFVHLIKGEAER